MSTDIERLTLRMEANMTQIDRALNKLNRDTNASAQRVSRSYQDAGRRVEASFQRMQRVATTALGAIGVGLSTRALTSLISDSLQAAENLADLSSQINANVEGLQTLRFAVDQNGGSADLLDRGLRRLAEGMGRVLAGETNEATRALDRMGLAQRIRDGEIRTTDELFRALADSLQALETQQERTAMASLIFGQRMGVQLSQALSLGSAGMAEFEQRARDAGLVLEEGMVRQGAEVNAQLRAMGQELSTRLNAAVLENADALRDMASGLGDVLKATIDVTAAFARMFQEPAGRDAVAAEIERLEARLARLRARGDGRGGDIDAIQGRIRDLRSRLELTVEFSDFQRWWEGQSPAPGAPGSGAGSGAGGAAAIDTFPQLLDQVGLILQGQANPALMANVEAYLQEVEARNKLALAQDKALGETQDLISEYERFSLTMDTVVFSGIKNLENAWVDFVTTGEASFSDFARSVLAMLARMAFQQSIGGPLSRALGGVFGGGKSAGGPVRPGMAYRVGERGAETFVPNVSGVVVPNTERAMSAARSGPSEIRLRLMVSEGDMFASRVEAISADVTRQHIPVSVEISREAMAGDLAQRQKRRLG